MFIRWIIRIAVPIIAMWAWRRFMGRTPATTGSTAAL
jgi:hypothetical protein